MPYNLFLLPIITGYLILTFSLLFKYNLQRLSRNRILFESVGIGVLILSLGFILRTILELIYKPIVYELLELFNFIPIQKPDYFLTILFSCLIGLIITWFVNYLIRIRFKNHEPIIWAIRQNGDEIERLFKDSVERGFAMQITLKNNKVYIGFSETMPIPQKTNYLTITPIMSGYRDNDTKKLYITTEYFKVVEEFIKDLENQTEEEVDSISLNTDVIIKQDEILSASVYEQRIYDRFNDRV